MREKSKNKKYNFFLILWTVLEQQIHKWCNNFEKKKYDINTTWHTCQWTTRSNSNVPLSYCSNFWPVTKQTITCKLQAEAEVWILHLFAVNNINYTTELRITFFYIYFKDFYSNKMIRYEKFWTLKSQHLTTDWWIEHWKVKI